jgi:hypothetical protein
MHQLLRGSKRKVFLQLKKLNPMAWNIKTPDQTLYQKRKNVMLPLLKFSHDFFFFFFKMLGFRI